LAAATNKLDPNRLCCHTKQDPEPAPSSVLTDLADHVTFVVMTATAGALLSDIDYLKKLLLLALGQCATPGSMFEGASLRLMGGSFSSESGEGVSSSV